MKTGREENPFEDPMVAAQWIRSVEGEQGMIRDKEIYPWLSAWAGQIAGTIVEIGSGQGVCSQHLGSFKGEYIGVEPSEPLVQRAKQIYAGSRRFVVGTAYKLPIEDESADGVFSVTVWFHLADLLTASAELARVLKPGAPFSIITTNPASYRVWETFYENTTEDGRLLVGKVNVPVNPLTCNTLYRHTLEEMRAPLTQRGLVVDGVQALGYMGTHPNSPLFINIAGHKE